MSQLITLLSLIVAALALYAYRRISVRADVTISNCNKAESFYSRWRKRYSRRLEKLVKENVGLSQSLQRELEHSRELACVETHYRNKYNGQLVVESMVAEYFLLFHTASKAKEERRLAELSDEIMQQMVMHGYEDLRKHLPRRYRNVKSLTEIQKACTPRDTHSHHYEPDQVGVGVIPRTNGRIVAMTTPFHPGTDWVQKKYLEPAGGSSGIAGQQLPKR